MEARIFYGKFRGTVIDNADPESCSRIGASVSDPNPRGRQGGQSRACPSTSACRARPSCRLSAPECGSSSSRARQTVQSGSDVGAGDGRRELIVAVTRQQLTADRRSRSGRRQMHTSDVAAPRHHDLCGIVHRSRIRPYGDGQHDRSARIPLFRVRRQSVSCFRLAAAEYRPETKDAGRGAASEFRRSEATVLPPRTCRRHGPVRKDTDRSAHPESRRKAARPRTALRGRASSLDA